MGPYLCIASNGVPPSVSQRIALKIQFPPMLWIPNQQELTYTGQDVTLVCHIEAYPKSINYWTTAKGDMIISGEKYEAVSSDDSYRVFMRLKIRSVNRDDFGSYKCVAKNSLGETDGTIKLYEIPDPRPTIPIVTTKHQHHHTIPTEAPIRHPKKKERKRARPNNAKDSHIPAQNEVMDDNSGGDVVEDEAPFPTVTGVTTHQQTHSSSSSRGGQNSSPTTFSYSSSSFPAAIFIIFCLHQLYFHL